MTMNTFVLNFVAKPLFFVLTAFALLGCGGSSSGDEEGNVSSALLSQEIANKFAQDAAITYAVFQNDTLQLEFSYGTNGESFAITELPVQGQLTGQLEGGDLSLTYTPQSDYVGTDSIGFTVTHVDGGEATGTVTINVLDVSTAEMAESQAMSEQLALDYSQRYTVYKNTSIDIAIGDSGVTGNRYNIDVLPENGVLTGQLAGHALNILYTPSIDFFGVDRIDFTVTHDAGGQSTGSIFITVLNVIDGTLDTDGDGLSDIDEVTFYETSPILADSDADGFSDYQEIVGFGFDQTINNFRFNPLIADIPQIDIELTSAPDIFLNYVETNGSATTISTTRSESSSSTVNRSQTNETSTSFEHSFSVGRSVNFEHEASYSLGDINVSSKVGVTLSLSYTGGWGGEESNSWTKEQSNENSTALEEGEAFEHSNSIENSGGGITVNVKIRNTGNISYTLTNLYLNASYYDLTQDNPSIPIGNMVWENQFVSEFPAFTLAPGSSTNTIAFTTEELSIATTKQLLADSKGLSIQPTVFEMLDENGVSYVFNQTGIQALDATVVVDFGGVNESGNFTKFVSTKGSANATQTGVSVLEALDNILQLDVTTDVDDGFITSINSIANNEPNGYWVMVHVANAGNDKLVTTIYTTPTDQTRVQSINSGVQNLVSSFDIANIRLHGGDLLHLIYMLDDDLDGVSNRNEFLYGTDVNNPDTDGDGLTDSAEITGWEVRYTEITGSPVTEIVRSNPLVSDTDNDQLSDFVEANINTADTALKRNPTKKDTDGDGIDDLTDDLDSSVLTGSPDNFLSNVFDKIDLLGFSANVLTPALEFSNVEVTYETRNVTEQDTLVAGNGIDEYIVNIYRHSASDGIHPEPLSGPIDLTPVVNLGQSLSCGVGCSWKLVYLGNNIPGAQTITFTEDGTGFTSKIASGETFKYIAYLRINGRYYRSDYSAFASSDTETINIHMLSGQLNNVKTIADRLTLPAKAGIIRYSAAEDELFYERGNLSCRYRTVNNLLGYGACAFGDIYDGKTGVLKRTNVYYDRCPISFVSNFAFNGTIEAGEQHSEPCWIGDGTTVDNDPYNFAGYVSDAIVANDLSPYTHPLAPGDEHFSLNWRLVFDGKEITPRPDFAGANTGPVREICGSMQSRAENGQYAVVKDGLDTVYLNSLYNNNDCSNISAVADNGDGGATGTPTGYNLINGEAVFSVEVPAQEGCHFIRFYAYEYDHENQSYNQVYQPYEQDVDYANSDSATLCRKDNGLWEIQHKRVNNEHDTGTVLTPVTNAADLNRIEYRTRIMKWRDDPDSGVRSTMQGDLTIRYDISVN